MRILLVDPSLYTSPYDGALAGALLDRGHEVRIAGRPNRPTDPPFGDRFVPVDGVFYRCSERFRARAGAGKLASFAKAAEHVVDLQRLRMLVREWRPEVVHWQWPSLPFLDAIMMRKLRCYAPQIVTVHDAKVFKQPRGVRRGMSFGWPDFLQAADMLIVHVPATRDSIVPMGVAQERVAVVGHGIFARPAGGAPTPARDASRLHVVFFGRLAADKGIDVLADAVVRLPRSTEERLCVHVCGPIFGDDPRVKKAVAQLSRAQCVKLVTRFVSEDDLDALLAGADVAVFPHREVDASGAMMKALGYDVGVLASDLRAFREVLGTSPSTRWFRCEDSADLAAQLVALANDQGAVSRMRAEAATLRHTMLSWADIAALTDNVYRGVLKARDRGA